MGKGLAVTSLVSGIVAFVVPFLGPIAAIVAIITGMMGRYKRQGPLATAGLILGIAYWVMAIVFIVLGSVLGLFNRLTAPLR